jgi:hypothetical protein
MDLWKVLHILLLSNKIALNKESALYKRRSALDCYLNIQLSYETVPWTSANLLIVTETKEKSWHHILK